LILSYTIYHLSYWTSIAVRSQNQDKEEEEKEGKEEDLVEVDKEVKDSVLRA
jgi:hypothetical protein